MKHYINLRRYLEQNNGWTILGSLTDNLFSPQEAIPKFLPKYDRKRFLLTGVEKPYSCYLITYPVYVDVRDRTDFLRFRRNILLWVHSVEYTLLSRCFGFIVKPNVQHISVYIRRGEVLIVLELKHPVKLSKSLFYFDDIPCLSTFSSVVAWSSSDHQCLVASDWSLLFRVRMDDGSKCFSIVNILKI